MTVERLHEPLARKPWVETRWNSFDDLLRELGGAITSEQIFRDEQFSYLACIWQLSQREQRLVIYRCKRIIPEVQEWGDD